MDLYAGLPFWIIKNALYNFHHPLEQDYDIDVAIIGSGITGALVAHELCEHGIPCAVFDKRMVANGSTVASTAQLQYEIDVPLHELIQDIGEVRAVKAYQASLQSIADIARVFQKTGISGNFKQVSTCYLASDQAGLRSIQLEYAARVKHGLPVTYLDQDTLKREYRIKGYGALYNDASAQIDTYKTAVGLLKYHQRKQQLNIFSPVQIDDYHAKRKGYELLTKDGHKIRCQYVVIAAGFEAGQFLPKQVMKLNSTYALVTKPIARDQFWKERSLIWETADPYFYMRTTTDNRIMMGGEDVEFRDPEKRDRLLKSKVKRLVHKFNQLYPDIAIEVDMAWCGTFSSTADGLPFIGAWPGKKRMLYALGYGGNGITFSMIAAQVIRNIILGKQDDRVDLFGFGRLTKEAD